MRVTATHLINDLPHQEYSIKNRDRTIVARLHHVYIILGAGAT
jgi:hypothetical protein